MAWITVLPADCIAADFGELPADIRVQAQERIDEGFHLGTVIGVIDRSGRHFYGFGQTSMTDSTLPDKHSIFEIASITKGFTAILVADLEIDRRVSTTAPIGRYVPTLRRADRDAAQYVTLERLLTHTAGLPRNPTNTDDDDDDRYKNYSTEDLKAFLSSWTINPAAPRYSYSNLPMDCIAAYFGDLPTDVRVQAQERIDEGFHLGTVIGVIDRSGRRFYGFGQTSMTDSKLPDKHSIFEIASITKGFTAILVADLEIDRRVSTTAPIGRYVPTLRRADRDAAQYVTLERLLTHTAGLPRNPTNTDDDDDDRYKNYSTEDLKAFLSSWTIKPAAPRYSYSNAGLMVVEHAIENEIGRTYEELMEERVLDKLSMHDTFFTVPKEKRDRLVTGFRDGVSTTEVDVGQYPAMGGLRSTADDILTYLGAHIGLVPNSLISAIDKTLVARFSDGEITLSLGWRISHNEESGKTIYHFTGGSTGFVSFAAFDRVNQKAVVVLVNGTRWFSDLGFKLLDPTYPLQDPEP